MMSSTQPQSAGGRAAAETSAVWQHEPRDQRGQSTEDGRRPLSVVPSPWKCPMPFLLAQSQQPSDTVGLK